MGSVIDYVKCPFCGAEGAYIVDYYYRTDETYCFCSVCGSHHNISLKRTADGNYAFNEPKHYDFAEITLKATLNDEDIAVASMDSEKAFDVYSKSIGNPKAFEDYFSELCKAVTNYILARPEAYAEAIENYKRGCYSDNSGDKYSVALWHKAHLCVMCDDKPLLGANIIFPKIDFDDTGVLVSECDYKEDKSICYGTYRMKGSLYTFEKEPTDAELQTLIKDTSVTAINVVRNGENIVIK